MRKVFLVIAAVAAGLSIAYIDSRPGWDDTGITAGSILVCCGLLGLISPLRPWVWALAVGVWVPLAAVLLTHNYGGFLAILFAMAGAYAGMAARRLLDLAAHSP